MLTHTTFDFNNVLVIVFVFFKELLKKSWRRIVHSWLCYELEVVHVSFMAIYALGYTQYCCI